MGRKRFSPSINGFFDEDIHDHIPKDSIYVTDEQYEMLLEANALHGKLIEINQEGIPVAVDRVESENEKKAKLKGKARHELSKSDITIMRCVENNVSIPPEWKNYRDSLRDIVSGRSDQNDLPLRPADPEDIKH